jgi:hypothetical protein
MIKSTYDREMECERFKKAFDEAYRNLLREVESWRISQYSPEYYKFFADELKKGLKDA